MNLRDTPKPFELSKEYIQKLVKKLEKVTEALFKSNKTDIIKNIRQLSVVMQLEHVAA